jgi:hypothetical protein
MNKEEKHALSDMMVDLRSNRILLEASRIMDDLKLSSGEKVVMIKELCE